MRRAIAVAAALLGLLCSDPAAARGHREVPDSELPRHKPTGLTFPAKAGALQRRWVHEQRDNPRSVRVGYGSTAWIEVTPSGETAAAKLASLKRSIQLRHTAAVVTQPAADRALFPGWKTATLLHRFEGDAPPGLRGQPRRDFVAARRCGKYLLSVRSWSLDSGSKESLRRLGQAVREIFADPCKDGAQP